MIRTLIDPHDTLEAEREALDVLVHSDGWRVFCDKVRLEWLGEGYYQRMAAALSSTDPLAAKVVHQTSREMLHMLTWPEARVAELTAHEAPRPR